MKYWIITAMPEEAQHIIKKYNLEKYKSFQNIHFFKNEKITLVLSWIGKIQASCSTTLLLKENNFEKIINIWIAWNTLKNSKAKAWDVFSIKKVYQHDIIMPFESEHLNYFTKPIDLKTSKLENNFDFWLFTWICATWDQFIADKNLLSEIVKKTNADVVEMEAFAVASVCREFGNLEKLRVIKAISDSADENALEDQEKNLNLAMENSIKVLEQELIS